MEQNILGNEEIKDISAENIPVKKFNIWKFLTIFFALIIIATQYFNFQALSSAKKYIANKSEANLIKEVLPEKGIELPVSWGDLGIKLAGSGAIDIEKLEGLYSGEEKNEIDELFKKSGTTRIVINRNNSNLILKALWAFGLTNKNKILEQGPMSDKKYAKNPGQYASTGGWTLSKGSAMTHYSGHPFVILNAEQQKLVERVAQSIYRPCCNNSTIFPDCNHGMAMLGLLELMAFNGVNESDIYRVALGVNSYWFPETYATIALYLKSQDIKWDEADPREILGAQYSSASGYRAISEKTSPLEAGGGSGCGV